MSKLTQVIKLVGILASAYGILTQLMKSLLTLRRGYEEEDLSGAASCIPENDLLGHPQTPTIVNVGAQKAVAHSKSEGGVL